MGWGQVGVGEVRPGCRSAFELSRLSPVQERDSKVGGSERPQPLGLVLFLVCVPLLLPVYPPVGVGRQCLLVKKWFIPIPAVILFCSLLSNFLSSVLIRGDIWGSDLACVWVGAPVIK